MDGEVDTVTLLDTCAISSRTSSVYGFGRMTRSRHRTTPAHAAGKVGEVGEVVKVVKVVKVGKVGEVGEVDEVDEADEVNEVDEVDEVGETLASEPGAPGRAHRNATFVESTFSPWSSEGAW